MQVLEKWDDEDHRSAIEARVQGFLRCEKLLPGFGSGSMDMETELQKEAKAHLETITGSIANRYHVENDRALPDAYRLILKGKATLIYLSLLEDVRSELINNLENNDDIAKS